MAYVGSAAMCDVRVTIPASGKPEVPRPITIHESTLWRASLGIIMRAMMQTIRSL